MPDETKTTTPADGTEQPDPGVETQAAEDAAAPAHDGAEKSPPFAVGEEQPPGPGDHEEKQDAGQEPPAPESPAAEAGREAALLREQAALRAEMEAREAFHQKGRTPRAPKQTAAKGKPAPAAENPKRPGRPPKPDKADKTAGSEKAAPGAEQAQPKKRGRPSKADKADPAAKVETPPAPAAPAAPPAPETPPPPREAPRPDEPEQIVYLDLSELHAFKDHPFGVRDDVEMKALVSSVKDKGVNQPAIVRPHPDGGYELIAGHRRQKASELAGFTNMPCIIRDMTDDEAVLAMTDDNLRQRSEILPSERAASLAMQVEAIKHQGARASGQDAQHSHDIVAARNSVDGKTMSGKQVQRFVRLTKLVPDLLKRADDKSMGFTTAVELSFISPKNQNFIAVAMDAEQSVPSQSQAKRLREMDAKGELNSDTIDAVLGEKKKEEIRVVITGAELDKYFGKDKTPQEMKEQIIKLLDDWAGKEKTHAAPEQSKAER